jgi:hypothetical protein
VDRVIVQLFTSLDDATVAARALDTLERTQALQPTHWSSSKLLRDPYNRGDIDVWIQDPNRGSSTVLYVRRIGKPAYLATIKVSAPDGANDQTNGPAWVEVKTEYRTSVDEAREFAELATRLAVQLEVECGVVDFRPDTPDEQMNPAGREHAASLRTMGLQTLYGRTFLSTKTVERYGGFEALMRAELLVTPISDAVYQVDLLQDPWSHSTKDLKQAQLRALASLRAEGFQVGP